MRIFEDDREEKAGSLESDLHAVMLIDGRGENSTLNGG